MREIAESIELRVKAACNMAYKHGVTYRGVNDRERCLLMHMVDVLYDLVKDPKVYESFKEGKGL
ncbi:hypothetical protein KY328_01600 [Candidatus Woesearchaeota archaeon]|nr:hypothetical protein [Candidatus Woesearchaeota archaeon]